MTNFTPGPWALSKVVMSNYRDGTYLVVSCPEGPGYGRVAMVFAECGREEELHHNGRLIAAAPELLEALEQAKGAVEWMAGATDSDPEDHALLELVNKAIAKATGQ